MHNYGDDLNGQLVSPGRKDQMIFLGLVVNNRVLDYVEFVSEHSYSNIDLSYFCKHLN